MEAIRGLVVLFVSYICLFSTFKGYPLAFVSWLGFMVIFGAWAVGLAAIFHPMGRRLPARVAYVAVAIILSVLGESMISWGGIEWIKFFDSTIYLNVLASAIGFLSGILNLDKNMAQ